MPPSASHIGNPYSMRLLALCPFSASPCSSHCLRYQKKGGEGGMRIVNGCARGETVSGRMSTRADRLCLVGCNSDRRGRQLCACGCSCARRRSGRAPWSRLASWAYTLQSFQRRLSHRFTRCTSPPDGVLQAILLRSCTVSHRTAKTRFSRAKAE